ncbi:MAG TPA: tyrosinase family protein [Pilimelia sp.]|nr:tyrosinase family protein [Pilimelia sp.]
MTVVRYNQADLSAGQRKALIDAILTLKRVRRRGAAVSVYDEFVRTHDRFFSGIGGMTPTHAHGSWSFLPWHRRFLLDFENALRLVNPRVSVPWWNWQTANTPRDRLFADDFFGPADDRTPNRSPFFRAATWPMNVPGQLDSRTLRRRLRPRVLPRTVPRPPLFLLFTDRLEEGPHNAVHNALGGHMSSGVSPNDPLFWLHHCFIDRIWSIWQQENGVGNYPVRGSGRNLGRYDRMNPWRIPPQDVLDHRPWYRYAT